MYMAMAIGSLVILSCESDDICTDPIITPNLIVRFYDKDKPEERKNVENLIVFGDGHPKNKVISMETTDSIALPLKLKNKETSFVVIKNAEINQKNEIMAGQEAKIVVKYTPKEIFADKGCGIKIFFENVDVEKENTSWIDKIKTLKKEINNENKATVYIYH